MSTLRLPRSTLPHSASSRTTSTRLVTSISIALRRKITLLTVLLLQTLQDSVPTQVVSHLTPTASQLLVRATSPSMMLSPLSTRTVATSHLAKTMATTSLLPLTTVTTSPLAKATATTSPLPLTTATIGPLTFPKAVSGPLSAPTVDTALQFKTLEDTVPLPVTPILGTEYN